MNKVNSILPYISSVMLSLTKTEQKIARFVMENPQKVIYFSITDLAETVHVGDASILRFCRKIGQKSYQGFKMALAQELSAKNEYAVEHSADDSALSETRKRYQAVFNANLKVMNETLQLLDEKSVREAAQAILRAGRVLICGAGTSGITAMDAMYKLNRIGIRAEAFYDSHLRLIVDSLLSERDVLIAISFSGSTKDILDEIEVAKKAGARIIAITHHARSPIAKNSDLVLLHGASENPSLPGDISTKIAQLMVVDILHSLVAANSDSTYKAAQLTAEAVLDKLI